MARVEVRETSLGLGWEFCVLRFSSFFINLVCVFDDVY